MPQQDVPEQEFSFKKLFVPLTTLKAIHWIIFIGIIVYANMLFNGFIWDDKTYVIPNSLGIGLNLPKLFGVNIFNNLGYYRPIPATYFAFIYSLFGQVTFFYHFPQLVLHITNTILLFIFIKRFFNKTISLFLSLIFLIHPMQVESVSYIAQAESVLFFFFGFLAFLLCTNNKLGKKSFYLIFFLLLLCLLTKETGILFFLSILIFRFLFNKTYLKSLFLLEGLVLFIYFVVRFFIVKIYFFNINFVPISTLSLSQRLLNIPSIMLYYIKTFFYPRTLAIDQQWVIRNLTLQNFYLPFMILIIVALALLVFGVYLKKRNIKLKLYIFFTSWFILGLGMNSQILPLNATVSDRWLYFPIVGLIGIIGIATTTLIKKKYSRITYVLFALALLALSLRTIMRNNDWQNPIRLYEHDAPYSKSYNLESNLGNELFYSGNYQGAISHFKRSASLLPYDRTYNNIGYIYELEKNTREAKVYYLIAMKSVDPIPPHKHKIDIYINISRFLYYFDDSRLANTYVKQGLNIYPNNYFLVLLNGMIEYKLNSRQEATKDFYKAYSLASSDSMKNIALQEINNPSVQAPIQNFYN